MAGVFITFEGPEGAGKSTQIKLLAKRLTDQGSSVLVTREPGGTAIGERIRTILLDRSSTAMVAETETLLLTAARAQHVHEVILPALIRKEVVLCDRFVESTLAYQGGGRGLSFPALRALQAFAVGSLRPTRRILLDIEVERGLARRMSETDSVNRLDEEGIAFHGRVRQTYLDLAREEPAGWCVIDADRPVDRISDEVWEAVQNILCVTDG